MTAIAKLIGDKRLARKMELLAVGIQRKIVRKALRRAARPVRDRARSLAPVRTGALRKSIKVRAAKLRGRGRIGILVKTGTREELGIEASNRWYYPAVVESLHQPYLRPALDGSRGQVKSILVQEMRREIIAEARKLRRL